MSVPSVKLDHVSKCFGDFRAVDDLHIEVQPGEFFGLLGPNGAGKSTTIKMITGLSLPTTGKIEVMGFDVIDRPLEVKRRVGLLGEDLALFDRLSGEEYLHFAGRMYDLEEADVLARTDELLRLLDLDEHRSRMVVDYSFGMKKKIALAGALIHRPSVLFLDEPFNGMDVVSALKVREVLFELTRRGITVFFSSHVMELVERLCTRFAIMHEGRIVASGTLEELRRDLGEHLGGLEEIFLEAVGAEADGRGLSWLA